MIIRNPDNCRPPDWWTKRFEEMQNSNPNDFYEKIYNVTKDDVLMDEEKLTTITSTYLHLSPLNLDELVKATIRFLKEMQTAETDLMANMTRV